MKEGIEMWFEPLTAWVVSLFTTGIPLSKEKFEETFEAAIPAENWENKDLYHKDLMSGMSSKEQMRNVKNGRYKYVVQYEAPHKDLKTNKIIIENTDLYREDIKNFSAYDAYKWAEQGKYNLNPQELEIEHLKIEKNLLQLYSYSTFEKEKYEVQIKEIDDTLATSNFDYRNTESVKYWRKAHNVNQK